MQTRQIRCQPTKDPRRWPGRGDADGDIGVCQLQAANGAAETAQQRGTGLEKLLFKQSMQNQGRPSLVIIQELYQSLCQVPSASALSKETSH